jgi:hypothetical protein
MPTRSLPPHPSLAQLKLQANELRRAQREGSRPAAPRMVAHHPQMKDRLLESVLARPLALADLEPPYGYFAEAARRGPIRSSHVIRLGNRRCKWEGSR